MHSLTGTKNSICTFSSVTVISLLVLTCNQAAYAQGRPPIIWMGGGDVGSINTVTGVGSVGGTVWSEASDATIKQWNTDNGRLQRTLEVPVIANAGHDAAFSKNGANGAFISGGSLNVYRLSDATLLRTFAGGNYGQGVDQPAISRDGLTVAFLIENWANVLAVIGSLSDGSQVSFGCAGAYGNCGPLALSPDGKTLALVSCCGVPTQNNIGLYRASDGSLIRILTGHAAPVASLTFSSDSTLLASGSQDGTIKIWNVPEVLLLQTIPVKDINGNSITTTSLAFSPNSTTLASGDYTGAPTPVTRLWDVSTGAALTTIPDVVTSLDFAASGQWITAGGNGSGVALWSVPSGTPSPYPPGHTGAVTAVAYSPDGKLVASASQDQLIKVWDAVKGRVLATLPGHTGVVTSVAFSPKGNLLASASSDMTVRIWSTTNFALVQTLSGHTAPVQAVAFSSDGSLLASGSATPEQIVKLWDVSTWNNTSNLVGASGGITAVAFRGTTEVAAGSLSGVAIVWDISDGKVIQTYVAPSEGAMSLSFSPNGHQVAVGWTTDILLFKAAESTPYQTIGAHSLTGTVASYSPDGDHLISVNPDGTVKFWNVTAGTQIAEYNRETNANGSGVLCVAFSPNSKQFAYGRGDATLVVAKSISGLSTLQLQPSSLKGGARSTGTVRLSGPAPSGGALVALTSSNAAVATVPASVTVTAGAMFATFTVSTRTVKSTTPAKISGAYEGVTKIATLTITP